SGKQNILNANMKLTCQGGDRYSPVDETASASQHEAVYDEANPYSKQLSPALLGHFTLSYKINKRRKSHEFAVKVLNVTGYRDFYGHRYNFKTGKTEPEREAIIIPNVSYKMEF
ncbi:MAG: prevent-host-death protein, partial [Prevotellaceae bacterium]|nr:prevent-host-death protein [Prevotellaceae bacterium]